MGIRTGGVAGDIKGGVEVVCCVIVKPNKSSSEVFAVRWGGWLKLASYELDNVRSMCNNECCSFCIKPY